MTVFKFFLVSRRVWHDGLLEKHLYLSIMFSLRFCQIKISNLCQTFIEKFLFRCAGKRKSEMCDWQFARFRWSGWMNSKVESLVILSVANQPSLTLNSPQKIASLISKSIRAGTFIKLTLTWHPVKFMSQHIAEFNWNWHTRTSQGIHHFPHRLQNTIEPNPRVKSRETCETRTSDSFFVLFWTRHSHILEFN